MYGWYMIGDNCWTPVHPMLKLKNEALKKLCLNCGLAQTGNKSSLVASIQSALDSRRRDTEILSIDMGVRNLAFCHMAHDNSGKVTIKRWALVELDKEGLPNAFEQPKFAQLALDLVSELRPQGVDTVLIEKQRLRSNGLNNVPEWIAKVNLLEAMLHAILQCQKRMGLYDCSVRSIEPARVMNYWIRPDKITAAKTANIRYRLTKQAKMDLVSSWMCHDPPFTIEPEASHSWDGQKGKRDDLSDSLLQSLAWVRWSLNLELLGSAEDEYAILKVLDTMEKDHNRIFTGGML
uniref:ARAD1D39776p n=1 Tax=Blastobotrys adeninivorans TaxID=409370 RepID=A0A060TIN7_BLAAD